MTKNYDRQIEWARKESDAITTLAGKLIGYAEKASDDHVRRAILALLVAAASLGRVEDLQRTEFIEAAKLAWDEIHSTE